MQAIVVVPAWPQDASLSAEHAIVVKSDDAFSKGSRSENRESPERDQATLPFWTWFIENPTSRRIP
jgi:hypothetical protein